MLPIKKIREKLEAKGCDEAEINRIIEATMAVASIKKTKEAVETTKMALLKEESQCPSCKVEDTTYHPGWLTTHKNGATTFSVDKSIKPKDVNTNNPKVAKTIRRYRLCNGCWNRESILTDIETLMKNDPSTVERFQTLLEELR